MKIFASFLSLVTIILIGYVMKDCLLSVDMVPNKTNALDHEYLSRVHEIKNIDSLHLEFDQQMDIKKRNRNMQSNRAIKDIRLLGIALFLIIINTIIIFIKKKNTT